MWHNSWILAAWFKVAHYRTFLGLVAGCGDTKILFLNAAQAENGDGR